MSSQSKLRFEPQGWVAVADCFYVLPIAAKFVGVKGPSRLQQSLCQRPLALSSFPKRKTRVCRHPVQTLAEECGCCCHPSLSSWIDHQTAQAAAAQSAKAKGCSTFFQLRSMGPKGRLADTSRLTPWRELKCPFSNEINKPTQALSTQHSFPGVPSGLVWLCGQS